MEATLSKQVQGGGGALRAGAVAFLIGEFRHQKLTLYTVYNWLVVSNIFHLPKKNGIILPID